MFWPGEDAYDWDLLHRFTHTELIAAMWPRAVCIEFAEHDGTTTPLWHARAWEQVTAFKDAWGIGGLTDRIVRVHFDGIHEIHGVETFDFLNRWLRPEHSAGRDS
jgi:hypothetical protein